MTDYRKWISALRLEGIHFDTFINDDADMVIRIDYLNGDYSEHIFDSVGKRIRDIYVLDGELFVLGAQPIQK